MTTNDGQRTNLASSKIQTSRSLNCWFESNYQWGYGSLLVIGKKENGFANMYNIVEIRNFKPTVSE